MRAFGQRLKKAAIALEEEEETNISNKIREKNKKKFLPVKSQGSLSSPPKISVSKSIENPSFATKP